MSKDIKKGYRGWKGETIIKNVSGYDWSISTMKTSGGRITSIAQAGKETANGFSFAMFTDPQLTILTEKGSATEKKITELHYKALNAFEVSLEKSGIKKINIKTNDAEPLKIGSIMRFHGYGKEDEKLAVYKMETTKWGENVHYVNLDTLALGNTERVRPISKKHGIGIYYYPGESISQSKLDDFVIDAMAKDKKDKAAKESTATLNAAERAAKIEEGKKLVKIPVWAKAVIVAELYQNDSDSMTDYFSTSVQETVYLTFSKKKTNSMPELIAAAGLFKETKAFASKKYEQRDKSGAYSPMYYIGESSWGGWKVSKDKYIDLTNERQKEKLYIAAAEGRYKMNSKAAKAPKAEVIPQGDVKFKLAEFNHSKTGKKIFVASFIDRVDKAVFASYRSRAKMFKGYYSGYSKDGAIAGFLFNTIEDRGQFYKPKGQDKPKPSPSPKPEPKPSPKPEQTFTAGQVYEDPEGNQIKITKVSGSKIFTAIKFTYDREFEKNTADTSKNWENLFEKDKFKLLKVLPPVKPAPKPEPQKPNKKGNASIDPIAVLEYEIGIAQEQIAQINEFVSNQGNIPMVRMVHAIPKMTPESVKKETGLGTGSKKDIATVWLANNGVTLTKASESVHEDVPGTMSQPEIRNFIIDVVQYPSKKAFIDELTGAALLPGLKKDLKEKEAELEKVMAAMHSEDPDKKKAPAPKNKPGGNEARKKAKEQVAEAAKDLPAGSLNVVQVVKIGRQLQAIRGYYGVIDSMHENKRRLAPTKENLIKWANDPGRFDLIGVDNGKAVTVTVNKKKGERLIYAGLFGVFYDTK